MKLAVLLVLALTASCSKACKNDEAPKDAPRAVRSSATPRANVRLVYELDLDAVVAGKRDALAEDLKKELAAREVKAKVSAFGTTHVRVALASAGDRPK